MSNHTPSSIISALGGPTVISRAIGAPIGTVFAWGARGSIPVRYWPAMIGLATLRRVPGITADVFIAAHQPRPVAEQGAS